MKNMSVWFEGFIEKLDNQKSSLPRVLVVLVVLLIGAGSLYMLLNSPG